MSAPVGVPGLFDATSNRHARQIGACVSLSIITSLARRCRMESGGKHPRHVRCQIYEIAALRRALKDGEAILRKYS